MSNDARERLAEILWDAVEAQSLVKLPHQQKGAIVKALCDRLEAVLAQGDEQALAEQAARLHDDYKTMNAEIVRCHEKLAELEHPVAPTHDDKCWFQQGEKPPTDEQFLSNCQRFLGCLKRNDWDEDKAMEEYKRTAPAAAPQDDNRCAVCGWPLADSTDSGCVVGNCSMRPLPKEPLEPERAYREYGGKYWPKPEQPPAPTPDAVMELVEAAKQMDELLDRNGIARSAWRDAIAAVERQQAAQPLFPCSVCGEPCSKTQPNVVCAKCWDQHMQALKERDALREKAAKYDAGVRKIFKDLDPIRVTINELRALGAEEVQGG